MSGVPRAVSLPVLFLLTWCAASLDSVARGEDARPELADLTCLDVVVEPLDPEAESIGLTNELLRSALLVAVRNKMPKVEVGECDSFLYANVLFLFERGGGGEVTRFSAYVPIQLVRGVSRGAGGEYFNATVWEMASLLGGTRDQGSDKIVKEIGQLVTRFASDYYAAGNE